MKRTLALFLAATTLSLPAHAGPLVPPAGAVGSTFKTLDQVDPVIAVETLPGDATAEYVISQPGHYRLTRHLVLASARHGVKITAHDVTLDLAGFTISAIGQNGDDGVFVTGAVRGVVIRNGSVRFLAGDGISTQGGVSARVEDIKVYSVGGNGFLLGNHAEALRCEAEANGGTGFLAGTDCRLQDCRAEANEQDGFYTGARALVTGCTAAGNLDDGFLLTDGASVSDCRAQNNSGDGFEATSHSNIRACTAMSNGAAGFRLNGMGSLRFSNASYNMTGIRSETGQGLVISENEVSDNSGYGIWMNGGQGSRIEANQLSSNSGVGIYLNSNGNNLVIRNTFRANSNGSGANYTFNAGNHPAAVLSDPASLFTSSNAFANIEY